MFWSVESFLKLHGTLAKQLPCKQLLLVVRCLTEAIFATHIRNPGSQNTFVILILICSDYREKYTWRKIETILEYRRLFYCGRANAIEFLDVGEHWTDCRSHCKLPSVSQRRPLLRLSTRDWIFARCANQWGLQCVGGHMLKLERFSLTLTIQLLKYHYLNSLVDEHRGPSNTLGPFIRGKISRGFHTPRLT